MPQNAAFHQYLHCLLKVKMIFRQNNTIFYENYNLTPLDMCNGLSRVQTKIGKQNSRTFFIFQGLNFFPILYKTLRKKCTFFSWEHQNEKVHSISLILTPVIKNGTTSQNEKNRIQVAPRSSRCI